MWEQTCQVKLAVIFTLPFPSSVLMVPVLLCWRTLCRFKCKIHFFPFFFFSFSFQSFRSLGPLSNSQCTIQAYQKLPFNRSSWSLRCVCAPPVSCWREQRAALSLLSWRQTLMLVLGIILFSRSESERATICSNVRKCRHNHHGGGTWRACRARRRGELDLSANVEVQALKVWLQNTVAWFQTGSSNPII